MIKVFRVPSGKRQYLPLYRQIQESRIWQCIGVSQQEITREWLIHCIDKEFFFSLTPEQQYRIAMGEFRANY
jgi:hypothetical protein